MKERSGITKEVEAIYGIFVNQDGKVLLLKRNPQRTLSPGKWDLMGGDIKPGKSAEETLQEDAQDKLKISITNVERKGPIKIQGADALVTRYCFVCTGDYRGLTIDPTKYDQYSWFGEDEIKGLELVPGVEAVLEMINPLKR